MNKKLSVILGFGVGIILAAGSATAGVHESVANAKAAVQNVPASSFKDAALQTAYLQDLDGINETLLIAEAETETASKNQNYQDALGTVNNLILKTHGCDTNGSPDTEDWITNCSNSFPIHSALSQLAGDINALIQ